MAKAQRVDFEELKARADFRTVLAHYGLAAGRGDQLKVRCPFHDDRTPSCSINLGRGLFRCFGCPASGNVLDFVHRMEARGGEVVSIRQAGLRLAEICGLTTGGQKGARKAKDGPASLEAEKGPSNRRNAPGAARREATAPINKPLGFALKLEPHPYLAERGISADLAGTFGLGFCQKGSMAGRIAIAIHNVAGELVAYAGRWVGAERDLPEGEDKYKLPAGFRKNLELFNLHRVRHCRQLVVVEGYFGVIRLHGLRLPSVALMGNSISEEQVALLKGTCPALRFVTVLMDGDDPGREAAEIVAARIARHWWTHTVCLPDGTQPDNVGESELKALLGR